MTNETIVIGLAISLGSILLGMAIGRVFRNNGRGGIREGMKHFWFSEEQKNIRDRWGWISVFCEIDGEVVEYTDCGNSFRPHGEHDDYRYLGIGNEKP